MNSNNKKLCYNAKENWQIIENTHEPIISQHDFDLVQEIRSHKHRRQISGTESPFSGMVYCADCGNKLYVGRSQSLSPNQEHMMCCTYAHDPDECSARYIRTIVLTTIILGELNKLLQFVKENEDEFVKQALANTAATQDAEMQKARKALKQAEKRINELDDLFERLYEDNVSGKISDERFAVMSPRYEKEQSEPHSAGGHHLPFQRSDLIGNGGFQGLLRKKKGCVKQCSTQPCNLTVR